MLDLTTAYPSYGWFGDVNGKIHEFLFGKDNVVVKGKPITDKTIALGESHSPEYICFPAKAMIGHIIEMYRTKPFEAACFINQAPCVLCRVQNYFHITQQIFNNLGYPANFFQINTITKAEGFSRIAEEFNLSPSEVMNMMAFLWESCSFLPKFVEVSHNLYVQTRSEHKRKVRKLEKEFRERYREDVHTLDDLLSLESEVVRSYKKIPIDTNKRPLKVVIMGEFAVVVADELNNFLRSKLAQLDVCISDFSMTTFLASYANVPLPKIAAKVKEYRRCGREWFPYNTNGETDINVGKAVYHAKKKDIDGIFHLRPFGCLAETNIVNVLHRISEKYEMPILNLSFDSNTNSEHMDTRIEAFVDVLKNRRMK